MFMRSKFIPLTAVMLLAATLSFHITARAAVDPSAFVESLTYSAFETLRDPAISEKERFSKFRALLSDHVDMPRIGRFVLGANWKRADATQQAEYQKLFHDYVISAYAGRLKDYTDAKISIKGTTSTGKGEHIVSTLITHPKNPEPVHVDWRLRENAGGLQVLDMSIEGISMALTQRSEFASIIQQNNGDINALLIRLRSSAGAINDGKQVSITK